MFKGCQISQLKSVKKLNNKNNFQITYFLFQ